MDLFQSTKEQIAAEAVEWFLRFEREGRSEQTQQTFTEWLTRSPIHIEEYLAVSSTWAGLNVPDEGEFSTDRLIAAAETAEPINVRKLEMGDPLDWKLRRRQPWRRERRVRLAGIAVLVIVACAAWLGYSRWYQLPVYTTGVGEQRSVSLLDGSVVILNTHSEVRVRLSAIERHIDLIRGEAQFHVTKNPGRPFLVSTPNATVRAVGTIFNVRDDRSGTQVAVLEGQVKVSAASDSAAIRQSQPATVATGLSQSVHGGALSIDLAAGQRAAVTVRGIERDAGPTVEAVAGWTERRLIFRDQRLADVVAEFNRYRVQPVIIDDFQLADLKISGVFDASDPESMLLYLKSFETVEVGLAADGSVHLSRGISGSHLRK